MTRVWVVVLTMGLGDGVDISNSIYVGRTREEAVAKLAASVMYEIETYREQGLTAYQNLEISGIGGRDLTDDEIIEAWMEIRGGDEAWEVFEADLDNPYA